MVLVLFSSLRQIFFAFFIYILKFTYAFIYLLLIPVLRLIKMILPALEVFCSSLKTKIMFVIAHHFVQDPEAFWASASQVIEAIPPHLKLHSVFPSQDLKTGTCIWEAPNGEEVQELVDRILGTMSRNVCYEVNETVAIGLPQKAMQEAEA